MARLDGERFAPYLTRGGRPFEEMFLGRVSTFDFLVEARGDSADQMAPLRKLALFMIAGGLLLLAPALAHLWGQRRAARP